ncbi:hypothetical protein SIN8267_02804 [Sinobacterium norvegicum]|uniref:SMP-30/Gluconolactonase/LRE-like region domain-containing protein n=1 Tax=Sinobacterium norvegicum TaxID=1641715 RepID=A0ABM9AI34_9GAMM|nr:SMP-30/gluconolactonase/LRE family protein [Sinobacterium norvegicum]CAH0992671.1 hypothetical protein SIN8267_02804 [Sinobacterium norvegicum]
MTKTTSVDTEIIADGLTFPEAPRWHNNSLYFSDFHSNTVYRWQQGKLSEFLQVDGKPAGLSWLADGKLLVISMEHKQLLSFDGDKTTVVADLSALAAGICNDMVTTQSGYSYIGNFGFQVGEEPVATQLIGVNSDGECCHVADQMMFPNGSVILNQGRTLIVAETLACCLTAFDIGPDGSLSNRRVWADLNGVMPDGICIDHQQGVWVATVDAFVLRVVEGGEVTDRINLSQASFACVLDDDEDYLYICTSADIDEAACQQNRSGRIERIRVG